MKKILNIFLIGLMLALVFPGQVLSADYTVKHRGGSNIDTSKIDFSGAGQNDINVTGTYTGDSNKCYEVQATATSTYKWRANCNSGAYTTGVTMTTTATELENGIKVHWDTATGHTNTDSWKFKVKAQNPMKIDGPDGNNLMNIENDWDVNFFSSVVTSNNAYMGFKVTDAVGAKYLKMNQDFVDVANTTTLVAADSGKWLMSDTSGNAKSYTLPGAAAGLRFGFIVQGTGTLTVTPDSGDTITCGASSSTTSIESSTADDVIELLGTGANDWVCVAVLPTEGDWTYN